MLHGVKGLMKKDCIPVMLPSPRQMKIHSGEFVLENHVPIICIGRSAILYGIAEELNDSIQATQNIRGNIRVGDVSLRTGQRIILSLDSTQSTPAQGYHLSITPDQIYLKAVDGAGIFYGVKTLTQLLRQYKGVLPASEIEDYPDFPVRGIMLDISRSKVPTMETLFALIDDLSEWKINHLELYMEHTFAYSQHSEVWVQASPMTGEDILRLDAYCRKHFIELVPNQNSFGHMERWLFHSKYKSLAECPDRNECDWSSFDESYSLDPTNPGSLTLLSELYDELLPCFTSKKFNVGCDETNELGLGKSKDICEKKGKGRVYLEYLLQIYEQVKRHGRTMLFWGDIIIKYPELVSELPRDITVLEWGYEANHPFDEHGAKFAQTGIPFYVCPGTSTWLAITGRTDNCIGNLRNAACNGLKNGAKGYLITDWGDMGHWQYLPMSYLGFAAGAALAWCYEANRETDFTTELDTHVFRDKAKIMGKLMYDLGNAYQYIGHLVPNGSALANILYYPSAPLADAITEKTLSHSAEYIKSVLSPLSRTKIARNDASLIEAEIRNAGQMLLAACHRGLTIRQSKIGMTSSRESFMRMMRQIIGTHCELWMARNRVGGLIDSVKCLEQVLK